MGFFHGLYFLIGFQARRPFQKLLVQSDMSVGHWDSVSIDKHMHDLRSCLKRITCGYNQVGTLACLYGSILICYAKDLSLIHI